MIKDVYVLKVDGKRIFATSLFVECHNKQNEFTVQGVVFESEFLRLDDKEHREILKECVINLCKKNDSMNMDLKDE